MLSKSDLRAIAADCNSRARQISKATEREAIQDIYSKIAQVAEHLAEREERDGAV